MQVDAASVRRRELDPGGQPIHGHPEPVLPQLRSQRLELRRVHSEVQVAVLPRLPADDRIHGPVAGDPHPDACAIEQVEQRKTWAASMPLLTSGPRGPHLVQEVGVEPSLSRDLRVE